MQCLQKYAEECKGTCDYIILKASQFSSGFDKNEFGKIQIYFPGKDQDKIFDFEKVVPTLNSSNDNKKNFFYLYYKYDNNKEFNREELCKRLYTIFM